MLHAIFNIIYVYRCGIEITNKVTPPTQCYTMLIVFFHFTIFQLTANIEYIKKTQSDTVLMRQISSITVSPVWYRKMP